MSESSDNKLKPDDLNYEQAQLAYSIIENLIEHTRVVSDLIAMMAQVLDEDTTKALTQTPTWTAYLDSRRSMEKTREDVEKFADVLKQLKPEEGSQISDNLRSQISDLPDDRN
jgi:glutamine synthetase adenylyltransferase